MRDPVRWVGALVVVAAVAMLLLAEREETSPTGLERMLVYDLSRPQRFTLEAGERETRLLTWLTAPADEAIDTRRSELYALALRVDDPDGGAVLERTMWIPTHRSWRSLEEHLTPQRTEDGDLAPWDDRTTRIDVDGLVPEGGTLTVGIEHAPPGTTVLGVAFRLSDATPLVVLQRLRERTLDLEEPFAPWPFSTLPVAWQRNAARRRWDRLGALPPAGGGLPETVRIESWFDRLPAMDAPATGVPIEPGAALVWLVEGPTRFEVEVLAADGRAPAKAALAVRVRRAEGSVNELGAVDGPLGPVEVLEGVTEIAVALDPGTVGPRVVRARTFGGGLDRALGDPPRIPLDPERELVAPDLREVQAWRLAPDAVEFEAGGPVRVTLRPALGAGPRAGLAPAVEEAPRVVTVRALDASGAETGSWTVPVPSVPSPFERYLRGDEPASRVGEPLTRYLVAAEGAVRIALASDRAVDATVETSPDPDRPWVPFPDYELPPDSLFALTYEPFVERPWSTVAPLGVEALTRAGRSVAIDVQVRFEPRDPPGSGDAPPGADRRSLTLPGPFELLAEPDLDGAGAGDRVRLGDTPARMQLPPSGRLSIDYRVAPDRVGRDVVIGIDGRPVVRPLVATAGALRIDDVGGPVAVSVDVPGLFLARGEGRPAWQVRRVWRVADGGELSIDIPAGATSLSAVAYRTEAGGRVRWEVEDQGPPPAGVSDRLARHRGEAVDPWGTRPSALPLSFQGGSVDAMEPVVLVRPEGSPAARLVLWPEGTGTVWVRASSSWAGVPSDAPQHRRQGAEP